MATPPPGPRPLKPSRARAQRGAAEGGVLTQLLAGSMIGAILTGRQPTSMGLLDLLVLAAIIVWLIGRSRGADRDAKDGLDAADLKDDTRDPDPPRQQARPFFQSEDPWERFRSKPKSEPAQAPPSASPDPPGTAGEIARDDGEFLKGAKLFFTRVRQSLAAGDTEDLASFCSPGAMERLKPLLGKGPLTIMLLAAEPLGQNQERGRILARVAFTATLRAGPPETPASQERCVWIFGKPSDDPQATWILDAIEPAPGIDSK